MDGWAGWADILAYQYGPRPGQPPALRKWWTEATKYRSGGFDRILEPAPWSPTSDELVARGVRGHAFVQEIATCRAGAVDDYLEAVAHEWRPIAQQRGLTLAGAWRTAMRDTEAVLLWCVAALADFTRHLRDVRSAPDSRGWMEKARPWRVGCT